MQQRRRLKPTALDRCSIVAQPLAAGIKDLQNRGLAASRRMIIRSPHRGGCNQHYGSSFTADCPQPYMLLTLDQDAGWQANPQPSQANGAANLT